MLNWKCVIKLIQTKCAKHLFFKNNLILCKLHTSYPWLRFNMFGSNTALYYTLITTIKLHPISNNYLLPLSTALLHERAFDIKTCHSYLWCKCIQATSVVGTILYYYILLFCIDDSTKSRIQCYCGWRRGSSLSFWNVITYILS